MRPIHQKRGRGGRPNGRRPFGGGMHRNFDSNGPDIKIRGTANHIFDRYLQLARDANAAGDRIAAENFLQHAEHYYRIMLANGPQQPRPNGGQQPQAAESASPGPIGAEPATVEPDDGGQEKAI
jgi:hypothetical protein